MTTKNTYDVNDIVRRHGLIQANNLKLAAYTVLDMETGQHGPLQFHATIGNTVLAVMGEETAKLFARFVEMTLEPARGGA